MSDQPSTPAIKTVPVTALANLFELTEVRVQQLAKEGIVVKAKRGEYDLWRSIKGYMVYLKRRASGKLGEGEGEKSYDVQRTRLYKAKADSAELYNARLKGSVHDADQVAAVMNDMIARCRSRLLAIPTTCAPKVADVTDPTECLEILTEAVHEALEELANYPAEEVVARQLRQTLPSAEPDELADPDEEPRATGAAGPPAA